MLVLQTGVYLILNIASGDTYVGCSRHVPKRWKDHVCLLRRRGHHVKRMNTLARAYGLDSFRFLLLESCREQDYVYQTEQRWIEAIQPTLNPKRPVSKARAKPEHD